MEWSWQRRSEEWTSEPVIPGTKTVPSRRIPSKNHILNRRFIGQEKNPISWRQWWAFSNNAANESFIVMVIDDRTSSRGNFHCTNSRDLNKLFQMEVSVRRRLEASSLLIASFICLDAVSRNELGRSITPRYAIFHWRFTRTSRKESLRQS